MTPRAGIEGRPAPDFSIPLTVDAHGKPSEPLTLASLPTHHKLIYCFQSWCPGCHSSGFPILAKLVEALKDKPQEISFAVVQTVFEGFESNTFEAMLETQRKYGLGIPFAHDPGQGREGEGSVLMRAYRSGGTPWFILIGPDGRVLFNDFRVNAEALISLVRIEQSGHSRRDR